MTVPRQTAEASLLVILAPCNDCCGAVVRQLGPLATATPVDLPVPAIVDVMTTDLLTPTTTATATNPVGSRFTSFCVEVTCTEALASTANIMYFTRWTQGQLPLAYAASGTVALGPEFVSMWNSVLESEPKPITLGELVKTHCFHSSMNDRGALEFSKFNIGAATWSSCYSANTGGSNTGVFWDPIVIAIRGATIPEFTLTVKGLLDFQPSMNTSWFRVSKVPPSPSPSQEAAWWKRQRSLGTSEIRAVYSEKSRTAAPYVGVEGEGAHAKKAKALRGSKGQARLRGATQKAPVFPAAAQALVGAAVGRAVRGITRAGRARARMELRR